jgi:hypothetical protein
MRYRLVTLAEVRRQLVYDNTLSDAALTFRLESASAMVMDFIGSHSETGLDGWADSNGLPLIDDEGNPLASYLVVDSNGDAILDSNGDRQFTIADPVFDSNGEYTNGGQSIVPGWVEYAVICQMNDWDENRGAELSPAVKSLLARTRRPVVV